MLDSDLQWDRLDAGHVASWLSHLPFASALVSEQHRVVWVHPLCAGTLKSSFPSLSDTIGRPVVDLVHETIRDQLRDKLSRAFASDVVLELEGPTQGDETRWHLTRLTVLPPLADGRFALLQCFDVTARRETETALRESEARFRQHAEASPDWITVVDGNLNIEFASRPLPTATRDASRASSLLDLVDATQRARVARAVTAALGGKPSEYSTSLGERQFHSRVARLGDSAANARALILTTDVTSAERARTERDQLAEKLRQSQKMETIGQIATAVAHDFENVIVSLQGLVHTAKHAVSHGGDPSAELESVSVSLTRAADLTERLLALGGQRTHEPQPIPLGAFVGSTLELVRPLIPDSIGIEYRDQVGNAVALVDHTQLEQVLVNLCVNARDSIGESGGTISVVVDRQSLPPGLAVGSLDESYVTISISDTGAGMHPATLARVFEPFFSTRPDDDRTGLGLPIVQSIIARHGGYVDVSSEPGRGACFTLFLPERFLPERRGSRLPSLSPTANPLEADSEQVVLLAEDEPTVRRIVTRILTNAGYRVIAAADGAEAVELLRKHKEAVTVAMLDAVMPNLGGKDAYEQMQKLRPDLPVLFSSGYAADSLPQSLLERQGVAILPKPYDPQSLLSTLADLLSKVARTTDARDAVHEPPTANH